MYDNSNIRFKTSVIRSNLCDYSDVYKLAKGNITVLNTQIHKQMMLKSLIQYGLFITYQNIEMLISRYQEGFGKYYRDEPALNVNDEIIDFLANNNNSASFKSKQQITGQTRNRGTKDVEIMVPLKYLSNFWRTLKMLLINFFYIYIYIYYYFFLYRYIIAHTFKKIKTLSPGTNILVVPGKKQKETPN